MRTRSPPEFLGPTPQIRCVFLRKGHKSQTAPSLEQVSWVGFSRKSRNVSSTQNALRRLNDSCRSARGPLRSENISFFQALEQVSLCPTWRASQRVTAYIVVFSGNNQTHLSLEIKGASRLNNTPTQEGLLHLRLAEPLARVVLTIGLACSNESDMFGMEIEYLQCCTPKRNGSRLTGLVFHGALSLPRVFASDDG